MRDINTTLHIESYGQGETIVLLHGWAMHTGVWRRFAQQLAQQARVVCVDLPGHGRSPLTQSFDLPSIAAEIVAAMDEEPCYWVGWSLGSLVVLEIARQYPEKVRGLVLLAGTPCFVAKPDWVGMEVAVLDSFANNLAANPQGAALHFMALQMHGLEGISQLLPVLKASVAECPASNLAVLQAGLQVLKTQDLRSVLSAIHCPVLAILGTRDTIVPIAVAPGLQQISTRVEVLVMHKAGHVPFLSHPDATVQAITDFLSI